jgi:ferredoxin
VGVGASRIRGVSVDKQSCLSSGRCVAAAPGAFRFDDDHLAEATQEAHDLSDEQLEAIARACPGQAIELHARDGSRHAGCDH